jgi:hypothetical protein
MTTTADGLVNDYLRELERELSDLPRSGRQEVLAEIDEHIAEARSEIVEHDEAAVRNVLERLGDPADIAEEARERFGLQRRPAGWHEIAALVLLPIGGVILPVIGWFVGLILLWASDAWTTREKLLGTLVIPGGLGTPLIFGLVALGSGSGEVCSGTGNLFNGQASRETCTGGMSGLEEALWSALFAVLILAPIVVAIVLARRMRRPALAPA